MNSQIWWYLARAGGLVGWALLAASVLWGLALSTKVFGRRPRPVWLLDLHRFLGAAALVFTAIHVVTIALDTYVSFGPLQLLVPLTSSWHPVAVAWGIVAFYLLIAIEVTSLLRSRIPKRAWRLTHYLSFPLFALVTIHALSAGTDRHTIVMRSGIIVVATAVTALTLIRLRQAEQHDLTRVPGASQPARRTPSDAR